MNIFEVLSQGKSRLHEPSISAMLGYLLDPSADHGISDTFLRDFLILVDKNLNSNIFENFSSQQNKIKAIVELEVQYSLNNKRSDIDIQISLLEGETEIHRIIIENKIRFSSANTNQLNEYYNAILKDDDYKIQQPNITIVFLTPEGQNSGLLKEYENLEELANGHNKTWITWTNKESKKSVLELIIGVLHKEMVCEINPINEYMRHTLKGFVKFMSDKTAQSNSDKKMRTGQDIGNITDEVLIELNDGKVYRVIRRDSTQIQVFDNETGDKEIARHIMATYINENNLEIEHNSYNRSV